MNETKTEVAGPVERGVSRLFPARVDVSMFNIVEFAADADEQRQAPCRWGNVVVGHACYCHNVEWTDGPRKCPIYRQFGDHDPAKWHRREWELVELPMHRPELPSGMRLEMRPCMPDDDLGGCPRFEPANYISTAA